MEERNFIPRELIIWIKLNFLSWINSPWKLGIVGYPDYGGNPLLEGVGLKRGTFPTLF